MPKKEEPIEQEILMVEPPEGVIIKKERKEFDKDSWKPKTELGKKVKLGEIRDIDEILDSGIRILETEIVDILLPNLDSELLAIGQSKGKFGGGKKSIWRQTQKKTKEGNKPHFATLVAIGNHDGYIGVGFGKAKETVPAREKAIRNAKLNIIKIRRGCGSWACGCHEPHSIPFKVEGKSGSVSIKLLPAPKGIGKCIETKCQTLMNLAGIKDIHSKTRGQTRTKINQVYACFDALKKLSTTKINQEHLKKKHITEGKIK